MGWFSLIYRRQGRKNIKKKNRENARAGGKARKRTTVGKDANSNRRSESSQGVMFGDKGLYMLSNFADLKKKFNRKK